MSKLNFQAKILLTYAVATAEPSEWEAWFNFSDNEGAFSGTSVSVGDVLVLDTGSYEVGTLTRYEIITITEADFATPKVIIKYLPDNDNNVPNPDLSYSIGLNGIITRPSTNLKLLAVPSPGTQLLSDRFSFYLQNHNFISIVDEISNSTGNDGASAYEDALANGFVGTVDEWLFSLKGTSGPSAYEQAVTAGFEGTLEEWLESLKGKSAYDLAVAAGFEGTMEEWSATSLSDVADPENGLYFRTPGSWVKAKGASIVGETLVFDSGVMV